MDAANKKYKNHGDRFSTSFSNFVNSLGSIKHLSVVINIVTLSIEPTFTQWSCLFTPDTYFNDSYYSVKLDDLDLLCFHRAG